MNLGLGSVSLCSCVFPYYCPPGSIHPRACPGGSEALNASGLRVSQETCCRLCEAGTYRSQALDALPCQPCPPGFSCHQGEFGKQGGRAWSSGQNWAETGEADGGGRRREACRTPGSVRGTGPWFFSARPAA